MENDNRTMNDLVSEFSDEKIFREEQAKKAYLDEVVKNARLVKANKTTAYRSSFEVLDRAYKLNKIKENKISEFQKLLITLSMSTYSEKKFEEFQKKVMPKEQPLSRREFYRQLCIKNGTYEGEEIESPFVDMVYTTSAQLIKGIEADKLPTIADYLAAAQKERMFADPNLITQRMTKAEWKKRGFAVNRASIPSGETEEGEPLFDAVWAVPRTKSKRAVKDFVEFPLITSRKTRYTLFDPQKGECACPNFENIISRLEDGFHVKINVLFEDTKVNEKVIKALKTNIAKGKECFWFKQTRKYAPQLCVYGKRINKASYQDAKNRDENNLVPLNKNELAALTVYELSKGIFAADFKGIKKDVKKCFRLNTSFWKRHGKNEYYNHFMTINEASCLLATQMVMRALPLDDNNVVASRKLDQGLGFAFANKMAQFPDLNAQWILPVVRNTALDMACKFYKELNISPAQLKEKCAKLGYAVPKEVKTDITKSSRDDYAEILFAARDYTRLNIREEVYDWLDDEEVTLDSLLRENLDSLKKMPDLGEVRVANNVVAQKDDEEETEEKIVSDEVIEEQVEEKVEPQPVGSEDFDQFIYSKLKKDLKEVLESEKIPQDDPKAQSYYRIFETVHEKTALKGLLIRIIGKEDYEAEYAKYLNDIEQVNLLREVPKSNNPEDAKRDEAVARTAERDRVAAENPAILIPYTSPLLLPAPKEKVSILKDKLLLSDSKYVEDLVEIADLRGQIENRILDLSILKICKETIDNLKKTGKEPDVSTVAEVVIKSIKIDDLNPDYDTTAVTYNALKKLANTKERDELNAYAATLADGITRLDLDKVIATIEGEIETLKDSRVALMTGINQTIVDQDMVVEAKVVSLLNTEFSYDCTCTQWFKDGKVFDKEKCNAILAQVDEKIVDETRKSVNSLKIEFNKTTKTLEEQFEASKKKIFADLQKKIYAAVSEIGIQANKKLINATKNTKVNELTALKDLTYSIFIRGTTAEKKVPASVLNPTYSSDGMTVKNYTAIVDSYKEQAIQDVNGVALKLFEEIIADMQKNPDKYKKVDAQNNAKLLTPTTIVNKFFGGIAARREGIRDLVSESISKYAVSLANLKDIADDMKISVDELSRNMSKSETYTEVIAKKLSVDKTEVETKVKLIQKDDGELAK